MAPLRRQRIWSFTGGKGGPGKTMMAQCIAYQAYEGGNRVLFVDGDSQGSAVTASQRMRMSRSDISYLPHEVPDAQSGKRALLILPALDEALTLGWCHEGDHVVPFAELVDEFKPTLIVLDPPGRLAEMQRAIIAASQVTILVTAQGQTDRDSLRGSVALIREVQEQEPTLVARILLNKLYGAPALEAEEAAREMGLPILETRIPRRLAYDEAFSRKRKGLPPRREVGKDIAALYSELRSLG